MISYSSKLYKASPITIQEKIISFRFLIRKLLREGSTFRTIYNEISKTQWMTREEISVYQREKLSGILAHVRQVIPYYRDMLSDVSDDEFSQMDSVDLLRKLPILTKKTVVENRDSLINPRHKGLKFKSATSGTTGLSMVGFRDLFSINYENAFIRRQLDWAGYISGQRRAWIRGDMIVPSDVNIPPYWRHNKADKMLMLSAYHLSESTIPAYIQMLENFDPYIIQAYPSAISFLAEYLLSEGRQYRGKNLKGIVTSSEALLPMQKASVEAAMKAKVFDWYGSFERTVAIGTCEHGSYHLLSDYSYVEYLPEDGDEVELIGSGFGNYLMPLFRYRVGDHVVLAGDSFRCPCGRAFPVVERVIGRVDDVIKTPNGKRIGMAINILDGVGNIWEGQIVQDKLDEITINIVPNGVFAEENSLQLKAQAAALIGPDVTVNIKLVESLPRTKNGKLRTVICNI